MPNPTRLTAGGVEFVHDVPVGEPQPARLSAGGVEFVVDRLAPSILTQTVPAVFVGGAYSVQVELEEALGTPPFTFSVTDGALPAGLSLDPDTGEITGTTAGPPGTSTFEITVTGDDSETDSREFSIEVVGNQLYDDFSGHENGADASGEWLQIRGGGTWGYRAEDEAFYGFGGAFRDNGSGVPDRRRWLYRAAGQIGGETRILSLMRRGTGPTAGSLGFGIAFRMTLAAAGQENGYTITEVGAAGWQLYTYVNGNASFVASAAITVNVAQLHWMRIEAVGTSIRMRVWQFGDEEPDTWLIDSTHSGHSVGGVGFAGGMGSNNDLSVLSIGFNGEEPPLPPQGPEAPDLDVSPGYDSALMTASPFVPRDPGDETHVSTTWQITLAADTGFASPIVNELTESQLTAFLAEELDPATAYRARVRFRGEFATGPWSEVVEFETLGADERPHQPSITLADVGFDYADLLSSEFSHPFPIIDPEDLPADEDEEPSDELPEVAYFGGIQWQVRLASAPSNWTDTVYDEGPLPAGYGLTLPLINLDDGEDYVARVRHLDGVRSMWSEWSADFPFSTQEIPDTRPDQPTITIEECRRVGFELSASTYEHEDLPSPDAEHARTQWRLCWMIENEASELFEMSCFIDTTDEDLTSIVYPEAPEGIIQASVRYADALNRWSEWSEPEQCVVYPMPTEPEFTEPASGSSLFTATMIRWRMVEQSDVAWRFDLEVSSDGGSNFESLLENSENDEFLFTTADRPNGTYIIRVRACYPPGHPAEDCSDWAYLVVIIDRTQAAAQVIRFADYTSIPPTWQVLWDDRFVSWRLVDREMVTGALPTYAMLASLTAGNREITTALVFTELGQPIEGEFISTFTYVPSPSTWYAWRFSQIRFLGAGNAYRMTGKIYEETPPATGLMVHSGPGNSEAFPVYPGGCDCPSGICACSGMHCCICAGGPSARMVWLRQNDHARWSVMNAPPGMRQFGRFNPPFTWAFWANAGVEYAGPARRGASLSRLVPAPPPQICTFSHHIYTMITRVEAVEGGLRVRHRMLGPGLDPSQGWQMDNVWPTLDEIPCGYCGITLSTIYGVGAPIGLAFLSFSSRDLTAAAVNGPVTLPPELEEG